MATQKFDQSGIRADPSLASPTGTPLQIRAMVSNANTPNTVIEADPGGYLQVIYEFFPNPPGAPKLTLCDITPDPPPPGY
jgi:hypothetical protein